MQQATQPSPAAISDARKCDTAISELRQTKHRVAQNKSQAEDDWRRKAAVAAQAVRSGSIKAVKWIVALPGNIATHLQKPWSEQVVVYKGWWKTIKKEAKHYWMGCKLLAADVRVAGRLINKVLHGKQLTRRERKQLTRTAADVFRLVPFIIFVIVPFMELLLPVALKLFPNMLPSTFEDKLKAEEQLKKRVAAKLEVARFLQGTVTEMAKDMRDSKTGEVQVSAAELYQFMKRVRAGEKVNNFEIMKFAKLFNDELTLDNLERVHLVNLCRFVGIPPFGTDAFLVSRLRAHLARIKMDDRAIKEEGLDSLSEDELRSACRARGMRAPYGQGAIGFMRRQMQEWLDLSLNRALPSSLLLLSRAFTMTQPMEVTTPEGKATEYDSLKDALSSLPNKAIAEASMEAKPDEADKAREYERKLEQLRREEELIREEELEAEALLKSDTPVVRDGQTAPEMAAAAAAAAVVREAAASAMMDVMEGESEEEKMSRLASAKEEKMRKVISALAVLASGSGVSSERDAFMGLVKDEIERLNGEMSTRGSVSMVFHQGGVTVDRPKELQEIVPQKRLADKVSGILTRIEHELDVVDEKIGERMHILDLDNDGLISREELETAMGFLREQLGEDELRMLLDKLNEFGELEEGPINVNNLMQIAQPDVTPSYKSSDDAAKRDTLAGHSQAVAP
jgi:LETM1 and EF-hand domain-containing protein 1